MTHTLIYVVEDDDSIREIISYTLEQAGFVVETFAQPTEFWSAIGASVPQLVLLDIMLSTEETGIDILKKLKKVPETVDTPVIFLTAKASEIDKAYGLDIGADDYIAKPFGVLELTARVKAVLRRTKPAKIDTPSEHNHYKDLVLDRQSKQIFKGDTPLNLTYKEYELFMYLFDNIGVVISRNTILDRLWGADYYGESRTVDVHIRSLRNKLEDNVDTPRYIKTMRGHGYVLMKE